MLMVSIDTASPIELMNWAVRARPAAIVCDIDGTLAPIAPTPGEARLLLLSHDKVANQTSLTWSAPTDAGGSSVLYDTVRSNTASNFVTAATCVECDGPDTVSTDTTSPAVGTYFGYLIRAENACSGGLGVGPLGASSSGASRVARTCP